MNCKILLLLIFVFLIIYFIIKRYNRSIDQSVEKFTALSGIQQPLTTYDDYGTFNFLLHINDLPYYDSTYEDMSDDYRDYDKNGQSKQPEVLYERSRSKMSKNENFNKDSFINFRGVKVRRELIPANYSPPDFMGIIGKNFNNGKHNNYADADFDRNQLHLAIKKDRPKESAYPPQPYNIYFNKSQRIDPYN